MLLQDKEFTADSEPFCGTAIHTIDRHGGSEKTTECTHWIQSKNLATFGKKEQNVSV